MSKYGIIGLAMIAILCMVASVYVTENQTAQEIEHTVDEKLCEADITSNKKIIEKLTTENSALKKALTEKTELLARANKKNAFLKSKLEEAGKPVKSHTEIMKDRAHEFLHSAFQGQDMQTITDRLELSGKKKEFTYLL